MSANTPISSAPTMPADHVDSDDVERVVVAELELQADRPGADDACGRVRSRSRRAVPTKPAAGVIATSPATAPEATPSVVDFLLLPCFHQRPSQAPAAAPRLVARNADAARPFAPNALPALNPNHPNHRMPVPRIVMVRLWGTNASLPKPLRLPIDDHRGEGRDTGVDVNDGSAGEVECAELTDPAAGRPDPVGHRRVNEQQPRAGEQPRSPRTSCARRKRR